MATRGHVLMLLIAGLLTLAVLAGAAAGGGEVPAPLGVIDCRYENPELKAYADRISSCAP